MGAAGKRAAAAPLLGVGADAWAVGQDAQGINGDLPQLHPNGAERYGPDCRHPFPGAHGFELGSNLAQGGDERRELQLGVYRGASNQRHGRTQRRGDL